MPAHDEHTETGHIHAVSAYPPHTIANLERSLDLPGYVVTEDLLRRIHRIAVETVFGFAMTPPRSATLSYRTSVSTNDTVEFNSLEALIPFLQGTPVPVRNLSMELVSETAALEIRFRSSGRIELGAFGDSPAFQFNVDRLVGELSRCEQEYSAPVKAFMFRVRTRRVLALLLALSSLVLLSLILYYLYAQHIGVDVDPTVIPRGNDAYKQIAAALTSTEVSTKLNALLALQLTGFDNVQNVLSRTRQFIVYALLGVAVLSALIVIRGQMARLYPRAFFAIGAQEQGLRALERKRDIWTVAVVIGFLINVIAGLLLTMLTR